MVQFVCDFSNLPLLFPQRLNLRVTATMKEDDTDRLVKSRELFAKFRLLLCPRNKCSYLYLFSLSLERGDSHLPYLHNPLCKMRFCRRARMRRNFPRGKRIDRKPTIVLLKQPARECRHISREGQVSKGFPISRSYHRFAR